jgi:hypothetical protein
MKEKIYYRMARNIMKEYPGLQYDWDIMPRHNMKFARKELDTKLKEFIDRSDAFYGIFVKGVLNPTEEMKKLLIPVINDILFKYQF